ncbi:MAG TPA: hypothetical protein VM370_02815, partial [Candidatus Thermoplasmatota archaeon]|nr:hypothetical protein [Candidatus Thermoplasmatota archaeon]
MVPTGEFQSQWRERLASGSKLAAKALSQALKDDATRVPLIVPLTHDALATVRIASLRALEELAAARPQALAPFAGDIVASLAAHEGDAQAAALGALTHLAPYARAEAALALPLIAELLRARRPGLREEAARCLGRIGVELPESAPAVAARLSSALEGARNARAGNEAREILAALEGMLGNLSPAARAQVATAVAP